MDVYAIVTEKIINLLEQGVVPWLRPRTSTGLPRNLVSKKSYRGVNFFAVGLEVRFTFLANDRPGQRTWRTRPQRRGEHGCRVLEG